MKDREKKILIILTISLVVLDQILKIIFIATGAKLGNTNGFWIGVIDKTKSDNNIQYILISFIAIMALIRYIKSNNTFIKMNSRVILSFAIAGVISNTVDRIWNQATINYINIPKFTALNLGYMYILITWIGMAVILTKYTSERIKERNENKGKRK